MLGLVLLVIPYLGVQSLIAMKNFLLKGQEQAQLLTAEGIATVLYGRDELFNDMPSSIDGYEELPIYPLDTNIQLDAFDDEWRAYGLTRKSTTYRGSGIFFELVFGEREGYIYGLLQVNDSTPVNRDPTLLRLNQSDHVRLYFRDDQGHDQRVQILWEGSGVTTSYYVDERWRNYLGDGLPDTSIKGYIQRSSDSYTLEFRVPLDLISGRQLGLEVADAHSTQERQINARFGTFKTLEDNPYSQMVMRSPRLQDLLDGISTTNSRVWIIDRDYRVRASSGELEKDRELNELKGTTNDDVTLRDVWRALRSWTTDRIIGMPEGEIQDYDPRLTTSREELVLRNALNAESGIQKRQSLDGKSTIITAAHPIRSDSGVIGAVLLEHSTHQILGLQSEALERVATLTLISLLAVIITLLSFSARLAWRIRRLGQEASMSIDDYGRLRGLSIARDLRAGDEIGDLARNIKLALEKLNQHQGFLANIPRTLRHEINNPLNTISTSLDNLEREALAGDVRNPYLESARRGLQRISILVGKLADAANLEEVLDTEEMFDFDLAAMLSAYVQNQQKLSPDQPLQLHLSEASVMIHGSDMHIEQLLDKLLDNARDFSEPNEPILINLLVIKNQCELQVINKGPMLEKSDIPNLFQIMHSKRHDKTPGHFGLGLYVARIIAEHHGGTIKAENLADGSGPCFRVRIPLS